MPLTYEPSASPPGESKFNPVRGRVIEDSYPASRSKRDRKNSPGKSRTPALSHSSMSDHDIMVPVTRSKSRQRVEEEEEEEDTIKEIEGLSPMQRRAKLSENYDKPVSGRENWWRATIKETPVPGSYESEGFIRALSKRKNTYRFKNDGRKREPQPQIGKGQILLPGAYEHEDLQSRVAHLTQTYGFKNTSRDDRDMMTFGQKDKDINVSPNAYEMEKYLTIYAEKLPSKHWNFRSGTTRFPTKEFTPKEGPPPGGYDYKSPESLHAVSSSFKSKTPRFNTSHTKVPGPGSYDRMYRPMTETVTKMGRQHGIFFSPQFQAY